jgi:hypothetical protein
MSQQPDESESAPRRIDRSRLEDERDERTGRSAAQERIRNQTRLVDLQVRRAMERGEFDDLPGAGKPLELPETHDPDWWVKRLIEREQITGVAPPAIGLRKEDAELDGVLDREATPEAVRRMVEDFNGRVVEARRQLTGGPPVVTPTRDVDAEVEAWRARRAERRTRAAEQAARDAESQRDGPGRTRRASRRTRWWHRQR